MVNSLGGGGTGSGDFLASSHLALSVVRIHSDGGGIPGAFGFVRYWSLWKNVQGCIFPLIFPLISPEFGSLIISVLWGGGYLSLWVIPPNVIVGYFDVDSSLGVSPLVVYYLLIMGFIIYWGYVDLILGFIIYWGHVDLILGFIIYWGRVDLILGFIIY